METVQSTLASIMSTKTNAEFPTAFPVLPEWSKTQTMRAVVFHGAKDIRVERHARPLITDPKDVIVRVTATTVCGSDLHLYTKALPGMMKGDILGHEAVGVVYQMGRDVSKFKIGDRVVVSAVIACGKCKYCLEGKFSICDHTNPSGAMERMLGHRCAALFGYSHLTGGYPGAQAEYVRVPNADVNLLAIPDDVEDERALALSDIACTGWHACQMGEIKPGMTVGVWGCGPIGLMTIMHAKRIGVSRMIAVDCVPERLAKAAELGAETINFEKIPSGKTVSDVFLEMMPGGADVTVEAVGFRYKKSITHKVESALGLEEDAIDALYEAIRCCRKGGTISIVGDFIGHCNHFPIGAVMELNRTLRGGQLHAQQYWPTLMEDLRAGKFNPRDIYTHRMELDDAPLGYKMMNEKLDGCIKIVIKVLEEHPTGAQDVVKA